MKIIRERSFFITLGWDGGFVFCPCFFFLFLSFLCVCGEGSRGEGGKSISQPETEKDMCQVSSQLLSSCSVEKLRTKCLCHNSFVSFVATIYL